MKHVEFLGIPGAGKSTLCDHLVESLQTDGRDAYDIKEAAYLGLARKTGFLYINQSTGRLPARASKRVLTLINKYTSLEQEYLRQFLIKHPDLMALIFSHISANAPTADRKELYTKWFCKTISRYELANQHLTDDELLLFDEGFANRSLTLFYHQAEISESDVEEYASQIPRPDVLVLPEVEPEIACDRMAQRKKGFPPAYSEVDRKTRLEILRQNQGLVDTTAEVLEHRGCEIHRVDNTQELQLVTSTINQIVR